MNNELDKDESINRELSIDLGSYNESIADTLRERRKTRRGNRHS